MSSSGGSAANDESSAAFKDASAVVAKSTDTDNPSSATTTTIITTTMSSNSASNSAAAGGDDTTCRTTSSLPPPATSSSSSLSAKTPPPTDTTSTATSSTSALASSSNSTLLSASSSKNVETKKTAGSNGASSSNSGTESAFSALPTSQQAIKNRRKPSRVRKDFDDKMKTPTASTAGVQMVPQTPLMLTSAPPGQFMLVHHNGQCYMMSATQYFGTNQQIAAVRPKQQQQFSSCTSANGSTLAHEFLKAARQYQQQQQHQQQQQYQQQHKQQLQRGQNPTNTLAAAQFFYSQQQHRYAHQMHSQQQFIQPSIVTSGATLGQLARSLAPKPTFSGITVPTVSTQTSSLSVTTTVTTTTSTSSQGNDTTAARTSQQLQSQQLSTTSVQQIQSSMFPQGIQLRASQGSSGIVFQVPSGAYTYVQQLVTPQQRSFLAAPQLQQIPACIGQAVATSQQQTQQQQSAAATTAAQVVAIPATTQQQQTHKNKETPGSPSKESSEQNAGSASPSINKENPLPTQGASNTAQPLTTTKNSESQQSKTAKGGKLSGAGRKSTSNAVKIATPQPIAPTNLVPIGAPVPMMVMSTSMPQLSSFGGTTAVPFMGPNGQIIHQQLITNSSIPTHQMIPVFQQQQPSTAHFAVAQQPVPVSETNSNDPQKLLADEDNGFTDSGMENEPPPLLVQGESKDALDIHMMFTKEAERYYQKAGHKGKIVHLIEGFEIEESDKPFPCDPPCRLSDWLLSEVEEKDTANISEEGAKPTESSRKTVEKTAEAEVEIKTEKPEAKKGQTKMSPTKSETSSEKAEKKTRKRKTNELDRLLQMDFGPSHGRLCDILQKSVFMAKSPKEPSKSPSKPKGRPPSVSVEKQKVEKVEADEPVMERFIIEDAVESPPKIDAPKKLEESPATAETSLNSSSKSSGGTATGSLLVSFSDDELDTERCNYCNGLLRLKRLENHPQYCSKKCRKLWKKNPAFSEEQVVRTFNASPKLPVAHPTETSPANKDNSPVMATQNLSVSEPSTSGINTESQSPQQHLSPPTLTLKMVSPQQAEIVKSPRGSSASHSQSEINKVQLAPISPAAPSPEKATLDFFSRPAKTWTCDEVASWVASVTGNEECANTFRNQDIDGQSLLLLADNAHHNLGTLLGLKLGPVVKILNALKELCAQSINAS